MENNFEKKGVTRAQNVEKEKYEKKEKQIDIKFINTPEEAKELVKEGYEPVECSFGGESVVGKYVLDHHGQYSAEEPVSLKAAKLAMEGIKTDKFVVTGSADADQVYAIAVLSGLLEPNMDDARAIAELDTDPIGRDLTSDRYKKLLLFKQRTQGMPNGLESTKSSLNELVRILSGKFSPDEMEEAKKNELERKEIVRKDIIELIPGKLALVSSPQWGFDVWYESAPIVVAYVPDKKTITVGLTPKSGGTLGPKTGPDLLGPEGLKRIFLLLDERTGKTGWGGREAIGGSPRGVEMTLDDAKKVFEIIKEIVG